MFVPSRIKVIGDFIKEDDVVADVGADHGILELYLIAKFNSIKLLAIENKIGPYTILEEALSPYKDIRLSLSDGIEDIDESINTLVIAGMGGRNIIDILSKNKDKLKNIQKIVVDPHKDIKFVRESIIKFGYEIKCEKIVFEQRKFYIILEFVRSKSIPHYSDDELQFGYKIYEDENWPNYQAYLLKKNKSLLYKIRNKANAKDKVFNIEKLNERISNYGKN